MALVSNSEIRALEAQLEEAVRANDPGNLDVIGYGEITIAVKLSTPRGDFVCKRLAPISSDSVAERWASLIASYIEQLEACGIDVVETDTPVLKSSFIKSKSFLFGLAEPMLLIFLLPPIDTNGPSIPDWKI